MKIAMQILEKAKSRGVLIATAESCTGGMVSAALTDIAGSSAVFERGFVTYGNAAKIDLLNVSPTTLETFGAVSENVAFEMARGALQQSLADLAVAVTGIAGPGGSEHKPEGRVCFGVATPDSTHTETVEFGALGRAEVREAAREHALGLLLDALQAGP
jgi:nicotinamide-nucleotide amidase